MPLLSNLCMVQCGLHILVEEHTTPRLSMINCKEKELVNKLNMTGQNVAASCVRTEGGCTICVSSCAKFEPKV
jgi:hypothetical protein